ncbi:hypothetical protein [Geothrix fermentans]|uniref:hypothetical protein n=1 Tax=Geothrix fermentans TaxID=44676 RepID=UPI0005BAA166|nr:hypothetical protein [Geothrix fermentans]
MPSYEHKKIIEHLRRLDQLPPDPNEFSRWIEAGDHLEFLLRNAASDEIVIYASSEYSFIHAAIIPNGQLAALGQEELLHWDGTPFTPIASYVWGGGGNDVWLERRMDAIERDPMNCVTQLVFRRTFEGWAGVDRNYLEINQEYTHLTGIHWRPEERAYCNFDDCGDLSHVVSITDGSSDRGGIVCASFTWGPLEEYLAASDSALIRRFDFTLLRRDCFTSWPDGPEKVINKFTPIVCRQKVVPGIAAYTTGIQLITPRRPKRLVFEGLRDDRRDKKYVEFIAYDWRNLQITIISTNPSNTTNYFEAQNNSLPFELSPAFFKPEVILKYKTDKEKYSVGERDITCRAAWHLKAYDVNEAGQVFAYICYLRNLPYSEQLHWQSYNEKPKVGISERAFINDFKGKFTTYRDPLEAIISTLRSWQDGCSPWWTIRDERLYERISTPLTNSKDEWGEAFMDLAKLVIEGFEVVKIREKLGNLGIAYSNKDADKTITLLESAINGINKEAAARTLIGLRTTQRIRSKIKGHVSGREANALVAEVIQEHENFANHFRFVCTLVADELKVIADTFA